MSRPARSNASPPSQTADLIHGSLSAWTHSTRETFEVWMDSHKLKDSSRAVYRSQWAGFIQYLASKGIPFDRVDPPLIKAYLEGTSLKLEQRERIHRLIERAFNAIAESGISSNNPAAAAAVVGRQSWRLAKRNDDTEFLSENDHRNAVNWIETSRPPRVKRPRATLTVSSGRATRAWVFSRNRAICAVLLSAGLKPSELRQLAVNEVYDPTSADSTDTSATNGIQGCLLTVPHNQSLASKETLGLLGAGKQLAVNEINTQAVSSGQRCPDLALHVRATPTSRERRLQLPHYASAALVSWIATLRATSPGAAPGDGFPLFPRSTAGGTLTVRAIEYLVEGFFDGFRRDDDEGNARVTPQLLRNSFAAALFACGLPLNVVQERMGYLINESAARLLAAWREADVSRTKASDGLLY
ncbi:site-specific integrase [Streptomyces cavourensis]|nr:site-specific integrase [Streptomyces cavourensis]